jgi:hypothetical protein
LTQKQIEFVNNNYNLTVNVPTVPNDPGQNTVDRNIQEQLLRNNPNYDWTAVLEDKKPFKKNCNKGPQQLQLAFRNHVAHSRFFASFLLHNICCLSSCTPYLLAMSLSGATKK